MVSNLERDYLSMRLTEQFTCDQRSEVEEVPGYLVKTAREAGVEALKWGRHSEWKIGETLADVEGEPLSRLSIHIWQQRLPTVTHFYFNYTSSLKSPPQQPRGPP